MAEEVIFSTIQKLDVWLLNRAEGSPKELVEGVKNELSSILDFLNNSTSNHNKLLSYIIADVVELAHNIGDIVSGIFDSSETKEIKHRLPKLKAMMLRLGGEGGQRTRALAPSPYRSPNLVGLEEIFESLLREEILSGNNRLSGKGPYLSVIEGVAGIGKTTLARELYNHPDVVARFQCHAWVCVSGLRSSKQLLMELIVQIGEGVEFEALEEMDNRSLQEMLWQHLNNKPYLIVLDDADEDTCSRSILRALPDDTKSRVLLTTQSRQIRKYIRRFISYSRNIYDNYHSMKFLEDDKSWELFLKTVRCGSTGDDEFPKKLEKKGKKMLKQCGGLPLAIIEMGRQLAIKRQSGIEWEELLESPVDFIETLSALESTFHILTRDAKVIFMCLGFFEEGTTVRIDKLLQIARAQRFFIERQQGDDALNVLKSNSFVEIMHTTKIHRPKNLQMAAIFHRLSVKTAKKFTYFEILRNDGSHPSSQKVLNRAIYCTREKFNYSTNQDEHLKSLFFRGGGHFDVTLSDWERFEKLIILDMEGFGLKIVPESFSKLRGLRYLGLRNNHIQKLPRSLRFLGNLEVLDIAHNFMVEVPDIIWSMKRLFHLYMTNIILSGKLPLSYLYVLETLTFIPIYNWKYSIEEYQFSTMNRLRKLGIEEVDRVSNVDELFESMVRLKSLCNLILRGSRFKSMPSLDGIRVLRGITTLKLDGRLARLPSVLNFPPDIRYLTLVNSSLDEDPMPILEKLSNLYFLKLRNAYTGREMVISQGGFKSLHFLYIEELWHLRNIQVKKVEKWGLLRLEINDCPYLETLPKVTPDREGFEIVTNQTNCMKKKKEPRWQQVIQPKGKTPAR